MKQLTISKRIPSHAEESFNKYQSEIKRFPHLNPDEEAALAQTIHLGGCQAENARKRLVECNLRYVLPIAKHYQGLGLPLADLISEGNIGLIKAVDRFDDTRGFKFMSYAICWIRQGILQALAEKGCFVRLPQSQQKQLNKIRKEMKRFVQENLREPSIVELADWTKMDEADLTLLLQASTIVGSIDVPITFDSDQQVADNLIAGSEYRTDRDMLHESLCKDLNAFLEKTMTHREQEVLKLWYGIDCEKQTIDSIANKMRLTQTRVRQIIKACLKNARKDNRSRILTKYS